MPMPRPLWQQAAHDPRLIAGDTKTLDEKGAETISIYRVRTPSLAQSSIKL